MSDRDARDRAAVWVVGIALVALSLLVLWLWAAEAL